VRTLPPQTGERPLAVVARFSRKTVVPDWGNFAHHHLKTRSCLADTHALPWFENGTGLSLPPTATTAANYEKLGSSVNCNHDVCGRPASIGVLQWADATTRRERAWEEAARIIHVGRNEVAQVRAGTAQPLKRPKFRQCWRLLVPAYC
jgi:hypothetical protein